MTKIEFLKNLFPGLKVKSGYFGQMYELYGQETRTDAFGYSQNIERRVAVVFVDILKGGNISIKVKFFYDREIALDVARKMLENLKAMKDSVVDAATKADVYIAGGILWPNKVWVARLKCDKHW